MAMEHHCFLRADTFLYVWLFVHCHLSFQGCISSRGSNTLLGTNTYIYIYSTLGKGTSSTQTCQTDGTCLFLGGYGLLLPAVHGGTLPTLEWQSQGEIFAGKYGKSSGNPELL